MKSNDFRAELVKIMPGYLWTVHKPISKASTTLTATGTKSSGFNRLSTLQVDRCERDNCTAYAVKSAGFGLRAKWLHTNTGGTLARALRGLQEHYEQKASAYLHHANDLKTGRIKEEEVAAS